MNEYKKRIPIQGHFMTNKLDDNVYGWFQINSFAKKKRKDEYITLSPKYLIEEQMPWLVIYSGVEPSKARRKFYTEIKKYVKAGLLKDKVYMKGKLEVECFELTLEYDEMYYLMPVKVLEYLVNTQYSNTIRIYSYLMFKYQKNPRYTFTQKEIIRNVFNQKSTTHKPLNDMISEILYELEDAGFFKINHEKYISLNGKATRVKQIVKINEQPEEMERFFEDKSENALIFLP